jgi:transposase, IS6 family
MLEEIMAERGLNVKHTNIMRWVHQYSPIIDERVRKHLKKTNDSQGELPIGKERVAWAMENG